VSPVAPLVLLAGLILVGVEIMYRRHRREIVDGYADLCKQLDLPDATWLETLLEIRGLQDTRRRSLVYDWGVDDWIEDEA